MWEILLLIENNNMSQNLKHYVEAPTEELVWVKFRTLD